MLDNTRISGRRCEVHTDYTKQSVRYTGVVLGSHTAGIVVERDDGNVEIAYPNFVRFVEDAPPAMDAALVRALHAVKNGDVRAITATLLREATDLGLVFRENGKYELTALGEGAL